MKKVVLFLIFIFLFQIEIKGNPSWIPIDNNKDRQCLSITTIESNENSYKARIEIHGYYDRQISIEGSNYHLLSFDEPTSLNIIGEPALPIISQLIALPKGNDFVVKITNERWTDNIHIGKIMPSQKSVLEKEKEPPFEIKDSVYEKNVYQTDIVYTGSLQKWRGISNRALTICPVKYMPQKGEMAVLMEFVLEITFNEETTGKKVFSNDMRLFLNRINTTTYNNEYSFRESSDSYDYLIIAGNISGVLECQALADLQMWKAFKGYKTKLVSTNTIGTTATQIKQFISTEYSKGIKYVLFIGDSDKIPLYSYYNSDLNKYAKSDYWYGCMDGNNDLEADICIGRFSTNSLSELSNMVNKTISYENKTRSYGNEVLLVAHYQDAPNKYQGCSETIRLCNYNEPVSFTTAYGAFPDVGGNNATNAFVVNQINANKNIINYRGHGDYNQWWQWNNNLECFYDTQINSLYSSTNDIYFCIACQNGNIHNHTCFMETFMRSNHGAAGIIAATEDTYTLANNYFNHLLFSNLLNGSIYNIGDLNNASHIVNIGSTTGSGHNYAIYNTYSYLCGCDPSLEIWTDNPSTFNNYNLSLNGQSLTINNGSIGGYKVSVVNENGSLAYVINSTSSSCTFSIPSENFYLVLNKHNYIPRVIYVNVSDNYIQNKVFNNTIDNYYIKNATISAGYDVTTSLPYGNVSVESGSKLTIRNSNSVLIKNGFECKIGGELEIK